MKIISKKLLSSVLGLKVKKIKYHLDGEYDPCLLIHYKCGSLLLNIYELTHLCKVWAIEKHNIILGTKVYDKDLYVVIAMENNEYSTFIRKNKNTTEEKAVFKLCQYILDNQ